MECLAPDADVVLYGTGADEKRIGPEQIQSQDERDWAQTESIAMSFPWSSISGAGTVAWPQWMVPSSSELMDKT